MDEQDMILLREIAAQGKRYTAGNVDRRRYQRLVDAGFLMANTVNVSDVLYELTEAGRAVAAAAIR
ncbi:MAG: hypothetical protein E6G79_22130 [Alphaproteobacteria bacterium]|jgi:hypothetical protein|nr:MAG: hypothetical protein E6G79_22130 [Alphaproteobacteria bacterium]